MIPIRVAFLPLPLHLNQTQSLTRQDKAALVAVVAALA